MAAPAAPTAVMAVKAVMPAAPGDRHQTDQTGRTNEKSQHLKLSFRRRRPRSGNRSREPRGVDSSFGLECEGPSRPPVKKC
jgi:hypothetical protein